MSRQEERFNSSDFTLREVSGVLWKAAEALGNILRIHDFQYKDSIHLIEFRLYK